MKNWWCLPWLSLLFLILFPSNATWSAAGIYAESEPDAYVTSYQLNRHNQRYIQEGLNSRGYDVGRPDGNFGARTRASIKLYQADHGDAATGQLTDEQIRDLLVEYGPTGVDMSSVRPFGLDAREIARGYGGDCSVETAEAVRAHTATQMTLEQNEANVGDTINLRWKKPPLLAKLPLYLMVSFDRSVRFEGEGFYALTPKAEAPFGLAWGKQKIRVVIPYSPSADEADEGIIKVKPMQAGMLRIEAAAVLYTRNCPKETYYAANRYEVDVNASASPELIAEDQSTLKVPDYRLVSSTGDHFIDAYEGFFEVIDRKGGRRIARINGGYPGFSPSGYFFYAQRDGERLFGDVGTGRIVYSGKGTRLHAWTFNDSFAAFGDHDNRDLKIVPMLIDGVALRPTRQQGIGHSGLELNRKKAGFDGRNVSDFRELFEINLESNFMLFTSKEGFFLYTLGGRLATFLPALRHPTPPLEVERRRLANVESIKELLRENFLLVPFNFQVHYPYLNIYNFNNHLISAGVDLQDNKRDIEYLQKGIKLEWRDGTYYLKQFAPVTPVVARVDITDGIVSSRSLKPGDWRGVVRVTSKPRSTEQVFRRLEEFGIKLAVTQQPSQSGSMRGTRDTVKELSKTLYNGNGEPLHYSPAMIKRVSSLPAGTKIREEMNTVFPGTGEQVDVALNLTYAALDSTVCRKPIRRVVIGTHKSSFRRWKHNGEETWLLKASPCSDRYMTKDNAYYLLNTRFKDKRIRTIEELTYGRVNLESLKHPSFRMYDNRYLLVWGSDAGIFVVDVANPVRSYGLGAPIAKQKHFDLTLTHDLEHVVNAKPDGTLEFIRIRTGETILLGRYVDDEIVVWNKAGFYDATAEGAHLVKTRFRGAPGAYSFHQYEKLLKRPGLASRVLADEAFEMPNVGVPPAIAAQFSVRENGISIQVEQRSKVPATQLLVFQDGLLSDTIKMGAGDKPSFEVEQLPGTRWVSVMAAAENGLASLPVGFDLGKPKEQSRLHSLSIGIDAYEDPVVTDLSFAVADARLLAEAFKKSRTDKPDSGSRVLLTDAAATRAAVLDNAERIIAKATPGDTVIISFAGHGMKDNDGNYFLATPNTKLNDVAGTALPWSALAAVLSRSKARVMVILDACHAGAAGSSFFATNDEAASGLLSGVNSGIVIFAASKGREQAEEDPKLGHGLFSLAVADVVAKNRERHDLNHNGSIEISELYFGVKKQVVDQAKLSQTPWLARNQMIGDFSIF